MALNANSKKRLLNLILSTKKAIKDLEKYTNKKYKEKAEGDLAVIAGKAIDEFYRPEPKIYDRMGDLYNTYKVIVNDKKWVIDLDPSYMEHQHHQSNEIVFNNTIIRGFHGGSEGEGKVDDGLPWYRTPHPFYSEWARPAEQTTPPVEIITKEYEKYMDNISSIMQKDFDEKGEKILGLLEKQIEYMFK